MLCKSERCHWINIIMNNLSTHPHHDADNYFIGDITKFK